MEYLTAFITGGFLCLIGQILMDKTKLTPARILVTYVVLGVVLGGLGIYEYIVQFGGAGATVPLTGFGYSLAKGVKEAVAADGISGVHTEGIMNFLLNEAKRQDIGTILARDTSRISRDTSSFMRFERKFKENGIRFEYLSKPDNELPVTPMMEAFETAYKKRRTKNGKRA